MLKNDPYTGKVLKSGRVLKYGENLDNFSGTLEEVTEFTDMVIEESLRLPEPVFLKKKEYSEKERIRLIKERIIDKFTKQKNGFDITVFFSDDPTQHYPSPLPKPEDIEWLKEWANKYGWKLCRPYLAKDNVIVSITKYTSYSTAELRFIYTPKAEIIEDDKVIAEEIIEANKVKIIEADKVIAEEIIEANKVKIIEADKVITEVIVEEIAEEEFAEEKNIKDNKIKYKIKKEENKEKYDENKASKTNKFCCFQ